MGWWGYDVGEGCLVGSMVDGGEGCGLRCLGGGCWAFGVIEW